MSDAEVSNPYVSRGGLKLKSANAKFKVNFKDQTVLDIGSSTGGFSDYALQNGAKKVVAIELGSNQMASKMRLDNRLELHEKTNILDVHTAKSKSGLGLDSEPGIVVIDLSFVSLREILPHIRQLVVPSSQLIVLVKPQFEAATKEKHRGIIKNEAIRRKVLKDFEIWVKEYFVILDKVDSAVTGSKGNKERFYLLKKT
jgi:23S rRNA (cytidine1920-2'-O)/16S rRNA (cytidine1409-2'-O)-methyltransferase